MRGKVAERKAEVGDLPEDELLDGLGEGRPGRSPRGGAGGPPAAGPRAVPEDVGGGTGGRRSFESESTSTSVNWDNFAYSMSDEEGGGAGAAPAVDEPSGPAGRPIGGPEDSNGESTAATTTAREDAAERVREAPSSEPSRVSEDVGARIRHRLERRREVLGGEARGGSGSAEDIDARLEFLSSVHQRDVEAVRRMKLSLDVSRQGGPRRPAVPDEDEFSPPAAEATGDPSPDGHVGDCVNLWKINSSRFDEGMRRAKEALSEGVGGGAEGEARAPPSSSPPSGRADHFVFDSPRVAARERTTRELMEKNRELEEEMRKIRLLSPTSCASPSHVMSPTSCASPSPLLSPASSGDALSPAWRTTSPAGGPSPAATPRSMYERLSDRERRVNDKASRIISEFSSFLEEHDQRRGDIMKGLDM